MTAVIERIKSEWDGILGKGASADPHSNFFGIGGDSLKLVELWTALECLADYDLSVDEFLAAPTITTLISMLDQQPPLREDTAAVGIDDIGALDEEVFRKLQSYVAAWAGLHPTRSRLVVQSRERIPSDRDLFFFTQFEEEYRNFAEAFDEIAVTYGFRSGHQLIEPNEEALSALVKFYADEACLIKAQGVIVLVGYCQGALVALGVARELASRGRDCDLVLIEWHFDANDFDGKTILMYGSESEYFEHPTKSAIKSSTVIQVPGHHGLFFQDRYKMSCDALRTALFAE